MRNSRLRKPPCQQYVSSSSIEIIHYAVIVAHSGDDVAVDMSMVIAMLDGLEAPAHVWDADPS